MNSTAAVQSHHGAREKQRNPGCMNNNETSVHVIGSFIVSSHLTLDLFPKNLNYLYHNTRQISRFLPFAAKHDLG